MHFQKVIHPEDCSPRRHRWLFAVMALQMLWALMLLPMLGCSLLFAMTGGVQMSGWGNFALLSSILIFFGSFLFSGGRFRQTELEETFHGKPISILLTDRILRVERNDKVYIAYLRNIFWTRVSLFLPAIKDGVFLEIGKPGVLFVLPHRVLRPNARNMIYLPLSPNEQRKVLDFLRRSECREATPRPVWFAVAAGLFPLVGACASMAAAVLLERFFPWGCNAAGYGLLATYAILYYFLLFRPWPSRKTKRRRRQK